MGFPASARGLSGVTPCSGSGMAFLISSTHFASSSLAQSVPLDHVLSKIYDTDGLFWRGWEGELEGCLEEAWIERGLRGGKDLRSRGMRAVKKRLGGKDEQKGRVKEASLWGLPCWGEEGE